MDSRIDAEESDEVTAEIFSPSHEIPRWCPHLKTPTRRHQLKRPPLKGPPRKRKLKKPPLRTPPPSTNWTWGPAWRLRRYTRARRRCGRSTRESGWKQRSHWVWRKQRFRYYTYPITDWWPFTPKENDTSSRSLRRVGAQCCNFFRFATGSWHEILGVSEGSSRHKRSSTPPQRRLYAESYPPKEQRGAVERKKKYSVEHWCWTQTELTTGLWHFVFLLCFFCIFSLLKLKHT